MNIQTAWMNATAEQRKWWMMTCGWRTAKNTPSCIAKAASVRTWEQLSPAIQNVLSRWAQEGRL